MPARSRLQACGRRWGTIVAFGGGPAGGGSAASRGGLIDVAPGRGARNLCAVTVRRQEQRKDGSAEARVGPEESGGKQHRRGKARNRGPAQNGAEGIQIFDSLAGLGLSFSEQAGNGDRGSRLWAAWVASASSRGPACKRARPVVPQTASCLFDASFHFLAGMTIDPEVSAARPNCSMRKANILVDGNGGEIHRTSGRRAPTNLPRSGAVSTFAASGEDFAPEPPRRTIPSSRARSVRKTKRPSQPANRFTSLLTERKA